MTAREKAREYTEKVNKIQKAYYQNEKAGVKHGMPYKRWIIALRWERDRMWIEAERERARLFQHS